MTPPPTQPTIESSPALSPAPGIASRRPRGRMCARPHGLTSIASAGTSSSWQTAATTTEWSSTASSRTSWPRPATRPAPAGAGASFAPCLRPRLAPARQRRRAPTYRSSVLCRVNGPLLFGAAQGRELDLRRQVRGRDDQAVEAHRCWYSVHGAPARAPAQLRKQFPGGGGRGTHTSWRWAWGVWC